MYLLTAACVILFSIVLWGKLNAFYPEDQAYRAERQAQQGEYHLQAKKEFKTYEDFIYSIYDDKRLDYQEYKKLREIEYKYNDYVNLESSVLGRSDLVLGFDKVLDEIESIAFNKYSELKVRIMQEDTKEVFDNLEAFTDERMKEATKTLGVPDSPLQWYRMTLLVFSGACLVYLSLRWIDRPKKKRN